MLLPIVVAVAASCGGGGSSEPSARSATTGTSALPTPAPETGRALSQFVDAAGAADGATMWSLLSRRSQGQLGPTQKDFTRKHVAKFQQGLGSFAGTPYRVVLAVDTASGWGVATVAGDRVRQGKQEFATYAAALRREGGAWKLELGDPVEVIQVKPGTGSIHDDQPEIGIEVKAEAPIDEAGLWLDGKPLPATATGTDRRDVQVSGRPEAALEPGRHVVIVFGRSGDVATAGSVPFTLEPNAA